MSCDHNMTLGTCPECDGYGRSPERQKDEGPNCKFCGLGRAAAGVLTPCMPGKSHTFTVTASPGRPCMGCGLPTKLVKIVRGNTFPCCSSEDCYDSVTGSVGPSKGIAKMIATFKTADFASNLKAALLAASDDTTRPHLSCIRIELTEGVARFIATNGHWLWVNETYYAEIVGTDDKGKKVLGTSDATIHVPADDVKRILKTLEKGKKAESWDVVLDTSGTVSQLGRSISFKPLDVVFPLYAQVIPAAVVASLEVTTFDPAYIADITAAFLEVSNNRKKCGITIEASGGALDPAVWTSCTSSALAVLMPFRGPDKASGASLVARYRVARAA